MFATTKSRRLDTRFSRYEFFGGLLARESNAVKSTRFGLDFWRTESRVIDNSNNQILAVSVDYSVGSWEDARIWLTRRSCFSPTSNPIDLEQVFLSKLKGEQ